jgi:hypothetical protein
MRAEYLPIMLQKHTEFKGRRHCATALRLSAAVSPFMSAHSSTQPKLSQPLYVTFNECDQTCCVAMDPGTFCTTHLQRAYLLHRCHLDVLNPLPQGGSHGCPGIFHAIQCRQDGDFAHESALCDEKNVPVVQLVTKIGDVFRMGIRWCAFAQLKDNVALSEPEDLAVVKEKLHGMGKAHVAGHAAWRMVMMVEVVEVVVVEDVEVTTTMQVVAGVTSAYLRQI